MATKKQRRRREKERRHEYETVYVDEEGEEVEVEEPSKPAKTEAKKTPAGQRTAARVIEPPSWNRVLRRTVIFAPLILVFIYLTSKNRSGYAVYLPAIPLLVLLPPVMYLTDTILYRSYLKRTGKTGGTKPKSK